MTYSVRGHVDGEHVVAGRVTGVTLLNVLERRLLPVNVDSRIVHQPGDELPRDGCVGGAEGNLKVVIDAIARCRHILLLNWNQRMRKIMAAGGEVAIARRSRAAIRCALITENGFYLALGCQRAVAWRVGGDAELPTVAGTHVEPVVGHGGIRLYDDIITLTNTEDQLVYIERSNGNEVCSDNLELMAIELDVEVVVDTGVNEADEMLLAWSQRRSVIRAGSTAIRHHTAIDQDIVCCRRSWCHLRLIVKLERLSVEPVRKCDRTEINVIVG